MPTDGTDAQGAEKSSSVNRRRFIQSTAVGASLGIAGCMGGSQDGLGDTLNLFSWGSTYADPKFVKPFEDEYDCDVVVETFTSNALSVEQ